MPVAAQNKITRSCALSFVVVFFAIAYSAPFQSGGRPFAPADRDQRLWKHRLPQCTSHLLRWPHGTEVLIPTKRAAAIIDPRPSTRAAIPPGPREASHAAEFDRLCRWVGNSSTFGTKPGCGPA